MWSSLVALASLLALVNSELTGCAGYVEQPDGVNLRFKDLKVQLILEESNKLLSETEVAGKTGFFHVSFTKHAKVLIRLLAPSGWIFNEIEKNIDINGNDPCSKNEDILFQLKGFEYQGTITSLGSELGPSGISVTLTNSTGATFETETSRDGIYKIGPVFPGQYSISAKHPLFSLSAPIQADLTTDPIIRSSPSVVGYQITGNVIENDQPIQNVKFNLYNKNDNREIAETLSNENGEFIFEKIAVGTYVIKASFVSAGTVFTITPAEQTVVVDVENDSVTKKFHITGLTVSGTITDFDGEPIKEAEVNLNGQIVQTNENGVYQLENVSPGSHKIQISKADWVFDEINVIVASSNPTIDKIKPSKVAVCPTSNSEQIQIQVETPENDFVTRFKSGSCVFLPPGDYILKPITDANTHFTPSSIPLKVTGQPIKSGLAFSRYYRAFTAYVKCLDSECGNGKTSVVMTDEHSNKRFDVSTRVIDDSIEISHSGLNPGAYKLQVQNEDWCFGALDSEIEQKNSPASTVSVQINIAPESDKQEGDVVISQTGYQMILLATNEVNVDIDGFNTNLKQNDPNYICVGKKQDYTVVPNSCHIFDQERYTYQMKNPLTLSVTQTKQKIKVNLREHQDDTLELVITTGETIRNRLPDYEAPFATYELIVSPGDEIEIVPKSAALYIQPLQISVKIPSKFDSCLSDIEFDGLEGLFINGRISPPVEKAEVSLKINDDVIDTLMTKSDGSYKFGPMDPHKEYTIALVHDDYRFIQSDGYNFDAFELANVAIKVVGEDGREMADVLVKLSGPNRFRSVKPLDESGVLQFDRLEPGEYYLNLEKKEYKFEPNHVELNLAGRTDILVTGIRYQYSAIGRLTSLSNMGLGNCHVEAIGSKSSHCADLYEETTTSSDGKFTILGLSQECTYSISVKSDDFLISPASKEIHIKSSDVTDVEFSAFKVITGSRISGNIVLCPTCPLKGITATMYEVNKDNSRGKLVEEIKLTENSGRFFNFKKIESDGQMIEIEVKGPDDTQIAKIHADKPHKHVTLTYTHSSGEKNLPEKTQGQLGAAILIVAIVISTLATKRDFFLAHLTKSKASHDMNASGDGHHKVRSRR